MIPKANNSISFSRRIRYLLIFTPVYLMTGVVYFSIGNYTSGLTYYTLSTGFDDIIPFVPQLEFVYIILYLLPVVPVFAIDDINILKQAFISYIMINIMAFVFFILYPVYCPKPLINTNTVSGYALSIEHSMDTTMNSFPSLHAGVSLLVFLLCRGLNSVLSVALFLTAIMIGASAVLIKQHYVLDIAGGFLLAYIAYKITLVLSHYNYFSKSKLFRKYADKTKSR